MIVGVTSYSLAIYHKDSMEREKNYLLGAGAGGATVFSLCGALRSFAKASK